MIGLDLCPFARTPFNSGRIRFHISDAGDMDALLDDLVAELVLLSRADPADIETTLLVHPRVLGDFEDFAAFLERADEVVDALDLRGAIQIASFHPDYQFADTEPGAIENYTNRAPYPTLHLLREDSIEQAVEAYPETHRIYERNMTTLRRLGREGWRRLWEKD